MGCDGMQDNNLRSLARKTAFYCQSAIGLAGFAAGVCSGWLSDSVRVNILVGVVPLAVVAFLKFQEQRNLIKKSLVPSKPSEEAFRQSFAKMVSGIMGEDVNVKIIGPFRVENGQMVADSNSNDDEECQCEDCQAKCDAIIKARQQFRNN